MFVTINELAVMASKPAAIVRKELKAAGIEPDPIEKQAAKSKDGRGRPSRLYPAAAAKAAVGIM